MTLVGLPPLGGLNARNVCAAWSVMHLSPAEYEQAYYNRLTTQTNSAGFN
jgi:hypothetical protein